MRRTVKVLALAVLLVALSAGAAFAATLAAPRWTT